VSKLMLTQVKFLYF